MALATRDIKRRIRSIKNTSQITKAMEMIASVKMRKAVDRVLATRGYSKLAWQVLLDLSARTDPNLHPLLKKKDKVKKVGLILIISNRGLCGGFNNHIINTVVEYFQRHKELNIDLESEIILMGARGKDIMFKHGHTIVAEFVKVDVAERVAEISPMAKLVIDDFIEGKYDKVVIAYTDFVSVAVQRPRIKQLLPIAKEEDTELGKVGREEEEEKRPSEEFEYEYLFEPSPDRVLENLLPRLVEMQIYQAILESNASEHAARMMAMQQASDNAEEIVDELTLSFNQARQAAITQEMAEISTSRVAME